MKTKLLIATLLCALCMDTFAQTQYNPYALEKRIPSGIGFNVGFVRDLLRERTNKEETKKLPVTVNLNGLKLGVVYDATLIKGFGVSMALNYTLASSKDNNWRLLNTAQVGKYPQVKDSYLFQSIDIPIDWQYKFEIAKETYLVLYTGPTVQYNFYFKQTQHYKAAATIEETTTVFDRYGLNQYGDADNDGKQDYNELNITWGVGAGFQYQRYFLRGGYDFGIYSPYKDRTFNVGSGYNHQGRLDQWTLKIGLYLWEF